MANTSSYLFTLLASPWFISRFFVDISLRMFPCFRPVKQWSFDQAARVRVVRLLLLYWSLLGLGDRLKLKPGKEGNRFQILKPAYDKLYRGPAGDATIRPQPLGTTWTPARPPTPSLIGDKTTVALHFHGGGFVIGDGRDHDAGFVAQTLIKRLGCSHVCSPQYRLASSKGGRFPAPLQDALTAYLYLIKEAQIPSAQIILSGDSAGANMALQLLRYINDHGEVLGIPPPAAAMLWSPWVDVSAALMQDANKSPHYATDYINREFGRWGARTVSGFGAVDVSGEYLSPLHHPFGMKANVPLFLQTGDREVLYDDIIQFYQRCDQQGWNTHLTVSRNCPHDIILLGPRMGFAREAEAAVDQARRFLLDTTSLFIRS